MKLKFKSSEVLILLAASVMSFLANLPDSILGNLVDRRWLLASLTTLVIVAMFRYMQTMLLLTISILAIGANLPAELASALGVSRVALIVSLGTLITITLINRVTKLLPMDRAIPSTEITDWRQTMIAAVSEGNQASLLRLLAMNTNVNFVQDGTTPIHLAAEKGNSDMMRILISHGADFRMKNAEGKTPIEIALAKGISSRQQKYSMMQTYKQFFTTPGQDETQSADAESWRNQ